MGCALFVSKPCTRFAEARMVRKLSQREVADKTDIPLERIRAFENLELPCTPTRGEMARLGFALQFPLAFFLKPPRLETWEGHICGDGVESCCFPGCAYVSDWLCDWPIGDGKTCDLALCERHRVAQGTEDEPFDLCPQHAAMAAGTINAPTPEQLTSH